MCMKKQVLFTAALSLVLIGFTNAQNLITNGSFEDPATGKYRGDCQNDGCFNGNVPGWFLDPGCTDTGIENPVAYAPDGNRVAYAFNSDIGGTWQIIGPIEGANRDFTLTYWAKVSWSAQSTAELYFVSYFAAFEGTDTLSKEKIDTLAYLDDLYAVGDTSYTMITHRAILPSSTIGKNLAIGFDIVGVGDAAFNFWAYFDLFELTVTEVVDGVEPMEDNSFVKVFPNPSTGIFDLTNLSGKDATFQLFSSNGSLISGSVFRNTYRLDLSDMPQGMYILKVLSDQKVTTHKLIIQ
jgi:hypothetical protein